MHFRFYFLIIMIQNRRKYQNIKSFKHMNKVEKNIMIFK